MISSEKPDAAAPESRAANALMWVGAVAVIAMMLHICADVISRKLFGAPIVGTLEFVTYLYMIAVVFLPLAMTQVERGHVIVEVFSQHLGPAKLRWLDIFAQVVTAIYVGFVGWWGMREALRATQRGEVIAIVGWDVPLWPTRWLLVFGLTAMLLVVLAQTWRALRTPPVAAKTEGGTE